ncbi:MAG: hypothetical protein HYX69_10520 [Planctomycetia bacterium]|nr:hypothetical protein [Planctomycetia bacterium]
MSSALPEELQAIFDDLAKCIVGLGPYAEEAVLCGGLVPVIYRRIWQGTPRIQPLATFDLDWALPRRLACRGESLHDRMQKAGFEVRLSGSSQLPVTRYVPAPPSGQTRSPFCVEFLAPRDGAKHSRKGTNQGVVEVQPGLHAQTDPYLGVVLTEPMTVDAVQIPDLHLPADRYFRVPNSACFILQKALIRDHRGRSKQASDACHIYDVAMLTHDIWPEMCGALSRMREKNAFPSRWFQTATATLHELFASANSNGSLAVAQNYAGQVSEEEASRAMNAFLKACW